LEKDRGRGAISVVVVNWNRCNLLHACLQSLANQRTGPPFEVVVVDNGSADGSVEMVERCFSAQTSFQLQLIRNSRNMGFCAANNQGFAASRSEFVALLNNDAEAEPDWLESLRQVFEHSPDVGMAASKILVYQEPGRAERPFRIDKVGHLMYPDGQNRGRGTGELDLGQYDRVEEVLWPDGCAAMYRRAMLEVIGGFDEDFFAYADDAELGLRARIAGWRCLYTPYAVVRHHRGATLGKLSTRRLALIERNRVLLVAKLFPWSLIWQNGAYYGLRLAAGAWAGVKGKGEAGQFPGLPGKLRAAWALLRGDLEALRLLPKMLRKRRQTSQYRKLTPAQVKRLLLQHRIPLRKLSEQSA
jgi:GT2 family glycosyltransferase